MNVEMEGESHQVYIKSNPKEMILFLSFFLLILFAPAIENLAFLPLSLNINNMLLVGVLAYLFFKQMLNPISLYQKEYLLLLLLFLLLGMGVLGNVESGLGSTKGMILDSWSILKCFLAYFVGRLAFRATVLSTNITRIQHMSRFILSGLFLLLLVNLVIPIWPSTEYRMGITTQYLIFPHATYLSAASFFCMVLLGLKDVRHNILFLLMGAILIFFAARNKGLIFVAIFFFLLILMTFLEKKNIKFMYLIGPASILLLLFWNVIESRLLSSETSARSLLFQGGFKIAERFKPLGSGLGTYGSGSSVSEYSPIYDWLQFYKTYGFTRDNPQFLNDSYVAMLIGQFGYLGMVIFAGIVIIFLLLISKKRGNVQLFILILFLYSMTSIVTELYLTTNLGVLAFFLMGVAMNETDENLNVEKGSGWRVR
ncbi:hypothetical protein HCJ39_12405 [Listeria rocourtiae]|uniref:hypothetical protein n=1 Tax=Listeria rocourtiae TaxID=647910 RepID=UPI001629E368|nr:hypothetical protein [Listeria rocourtiae]MBC1605515.1 hypothetical protein [Listeria rocourtiae]